MTIGKTHPHFGSSPEHNWNQMKGFWLIWPTEKVEKSLNTISRWFFYLSSDLILIIEFRIMVVLVTLSLFNQLKLFWSKGLCCFITNKFVNFVIWNFLSIVMLIRDWPEESKETLPKEDDPLKTLSNSIQGNCHVTDWFVMWPHYSRFVKPSYDEYCAPTKKYADIVVPRGAENDVAINLIICHIQVKFMVL